MEVVYEPGRHDWHWARAFSTMPAVARIALRAWADEGDVDHPHLDDVDGGDVTAFFHHCTAETLHVNVDVETRSSVEVSDDLTELLVMTFPRVKHLVITSNDEVTITRPLYHIETIDITGEDACDGTAWWIGQHAVLDMASNPGMSLADLSLKRAILRYNVTKDGPPVQQKWGFGVVPSAARG
jgi:hypothetical protein